MERRRSGIVNGDDFCGSSHTGAYPHGWTTHAEKKVTDQLSRVWYISLERQVGWVRSFSRSDPIE